MRLAEHRLYVYHLRYARPVRWSDIVEEAAPFVLLKLTSDAGDVGVAEITVKPTWCGGSWRRRPSGSSSSASSAAPGTR